MSHMCTHSGEETYKCDSCGLCFSTSRGSKSHHLRIYTREKPFKCELCGIRSSHPGNCDRC